MSSRAPNLNTNIAKAKKENNKKPKDVPEVSTKLPDEADKTKIIKKQKKKDKTIVTTDNKFEHKVEPAKVGSIVTTENNFVHTVAPANVVISAETTQGNTNLKNNKCRVPYSIRRRYKTVIKQNGKELVPADNHKTQEHLSKLPIKTEIIKVEQIPSTETQNANYTLTLLDSIPTQTAYSESNQENSSSIPEYNMQSNLSTSPANYQNEDTYSYSIENHDSNSFENYYTYDQTDNYSSTEKSREIVENKTLFNMDDGSLMHVPITASQQQMQELNQTQIESEPSMNENASPHADLSDHDIEQILTELAEGSLVLVSTLDPQNSDKVINEIFMLDKQTGEICDKPLDVPEEIVQSILNVMS